MTTRVSYYGLTAKELKVLLRQWQKAKGEYRCELGHNHCGATTEQSQDGQAPCAREILHELAWRGLIDVDQAEVEA